MNIPHGNGSGNGQVPPNASKNLCANFVTIAYAIEIKQSVSERVEEVLKIRRRQ